MTLRLTVLGCAGSYPEPGNACSGYLVESAGARVVVDLGPGTLANLQDHVSLGDLDALVLTHQHPDHWLDLPILRNAMRYYLGLEGLAVHGTGGTLSQARTVIGEMEPTLRWTTLSRASTLEIGDLRLSFSVTDHPVETYAVRIEDGAGRSLVYTADTGAQWKHGGFVDGVDALLCEATVPAEYEGRAPHLSGRQAGALAQEAGVGRLLLTHVAPGVDRGDQLEAAGRVFDGQADLVEVGASYTV
jgi:ribonuclease BN (tRNA processing enzyme)